MPQDEKCANCSHGKPVCDSYPELGPVCHSCNVELSQLVYKFGPDYIAYYAQMVKDYRKERANAT